MFDRLSAGELEDPLYEGTGFVLSCLQSTKVC
jgi:hypothetical protein